MIDQRLQLREASVVQRSGALHRTDRRREDVRVYTIPRLLKDLDMGRRTFFTLRKAGLLPFLEEVKPRLGRCVRYRADLVDRYLAGQWGGPRAFRKTA